MVFNASRKIWELACGDMYRNVSSAYLNADLDVFVQQPPGFEFPKKDSKLVCKLLKVLHGLKQAITCWNKTLDKFLTDFGLTRSQIDSCCYSMTDPSSFRLFVCVWVDDIMYFQLLLIQLSLSKLLSLINSRLMRRVQ